MLKSLTMFPDTLLNVFLAIAVDNLANPFIFVVFCDAGAYPDYLITFKKAWWKNWPLDQIFKNKNNNK